MTTEERINQLPACKECGAVQFVRYGHFAECSQFLSDANEQEQPMSDTLPERESGTTTTDYCSECKGRPHAPWCSEFEPPETEANQLLPDEISSVSAGSEHQPAALGGGEETPERIWLTRKYGNRIWKPKAGVEAELQEYIRMDQHQSLVAERERLLEAVKEVAIRSLRYCEQKYDHDDQARLNLEALVESIEQRSTSE